MVKLGKVTYVSNNSLEYCLVNVALEGKYVAWKPSSYFINAAS